MTISETSSFVVRRWALGQSLYSLTADILQVRQHKNTHLIQQNAILYASLFFFFTNQLTLSTVGPAASLFSTNSALVWLFCASLSALTMPLSAFSLTSLLKLLIKNPEKMSTLHSSGNIAKTSPISNQPPNLSSNSPVLSMRCDKSSILRNSCKRKLNSLDCSAREGSSDCGIGKVPVVMGRKMELYPYKQ